MSATPPLQNPFKGLQPFEQADENKLFGRERDLILFKERILSSRTTLLFAGSGVGKTSFLNAKVIPELAKRYCVIWHNRWTGASEETENWDDKPSLKIWPPLDFAKWLYETAFGGWRRRRLALSKESPKKKAEAVQQKLAIDVQEVITQSLKPGNAKRLSEVLSVFRKEAKGELADDIRKKGCMLILDQFEEVFQYHVYEDYFETFIVDLCKIINDDEYQVRVVFSMREEFLGELTAFDNRIPDLFNNYYRLRYPKTDEAKRIITETCRLSSVEPHPGNLVKLVEDLSSIEKNFKQNNSSDGKEVRSVRIVRRDYVPPPYLQIVCNSLWKEEYEKPSTNGGTSIQIKRFLEDYKSAPETPAAGVESDAQRAVRQFCEAKLSLPFLRKWEQNIAARAFGFLVTKQGAKMAYELRSLAAHMEERAWALKHVLEKLSQPEARILRESRGPEGSYWFELYHDMYAGVVDRWKQTYLKAQRKRQRRQVIRVAGAITLVIIGILAILRIQEARNYQAIITEYATNLRNTDLNDAEYNVALIAYSNLKDTLGYGSTANSLWAKVWQRRAELFEMKEKREEAVISFLQAAALTADRTAKKDYLARANNLLLSNEDAIQYTYCTNCSVGAISRNARYFVTVNQDNIYTISSLDDKPVQSILCSDCISPVFSADGNAVAAVRVINEAKNTGRDKPNTDESSKNPGGSTGTASPSSSTANPPAKAKDIVGWEVKISPSEPGASSAPVSFVIKKPKLSNVNSTDVGFSLKSLSVVKAGYLVAGLLGGRLIIWRQDGSEFFEVASKNPDALFSARARFSPDGKFFSLSGPGMEARLFEVKETGLSPVGEFVGLLKSAGQLTFSPSSRYLLVPLETTIKIYDLAKKNQTRTLDIPYVSRHLSFGPDSDKFVVVDNEQNITVWDCDTGERVFQEPLKVEDLWGVLLGKEGKSLVVSTEDYNDVGSPGTELEFAL